MKLFFNYIKISIMTLSLCTGVYSQCMLKNIAKTHNILHESYKHLSIVHGAIAWETGVIKRLYDFGYIFPVYGQDKLERTIIEKYENLEQTDPIAHLVHTMFYRIPESTSETDFGPTNQVQYDDPVKTVQTLAKILALCENIQAEDLIFQNSLNALSTHKTLKVLSPKLIKNPLLIAGQNRPALQLFTEHVALHKKKKQPNYQKQVNDVEAITKFCEKVRVTQNHFNGLLKPHARPGAHMGQIVLYSLRQSDPENKQALYPPHILQMVMLAFVYKKYSNDRNVLRSFYDELNNNLDNKVLMTDLDDAWVKESFKPTNQSEALDQIQSILSTENPIQNIYQNFDTLVYYANQIRSFPKLVSDMEIMYEYDHDKKTPKFTDCMGNALRNFINVYAYDAEQNKFALEKLQTITGQSKVHTNLIQFLNDFNNVTLASSPEAYHAWVTVVSNIPYIAYNNIIDKVTGKSKTATNKGYIVLSKDDHINGLKKNGYQIVETNQYGYELQPSIKNMIIAFDYLLQLDLFSDAGGLANEFMRSDFIAIYFLKLCTILNATGFLSTQKDAQEGELNNDFDALDYTKSKTYATIDLIRTICKFTLCSDHGELKLITAEGSPKIGSLLQKIHTFTGQPSLSLLATNLISKQHIQLNHLTNNPEYAYINIFAAPIEKGASFLTIKEIFSIITPTTSLTKKMYITSFLLQIADKYHPVARWSMRLFTYALFLDSLTHDDLKKVNVSNEFKNYIDILEIVFRSQNMHMQYASLKLLSSFVKKDQGFQEALQIAEKIFTQPLQKNTKENNSELQSLGLDLLGQLIIKTPETTKQTIQKIVDNPNVHLNNFEKLKLYKLLG